MSNKLIPTDPFVPTNLVRSIPSSPLSAESLYAANFVTVPSPALPQAFLSGPARSCQSFCSKSSSIPRPPSQVTSPFMPTPTISWPYIVNE